MLAFDLLMTVSRKGGAYMPGRWFNRTTAALVRKEVSRQFRAFGIGLGTPRSFFEDTLGDPHWKNHLMSPQFALTAP
jgi:hypothetical protein